MNVKYFAVVIGLWVAVIANTALASSRTEFRAVGDLIGRIEIHKVEPEDTFYDIARRYKVGLVQLMAANPGVDVWVPPVGRELIIPGLHVLPKDRKPGVVINLSKLRMFHFTADGRIFSYPIGVGREGWQTPVGKTTMTRLRKDPVWIPPPSIRKESPNLPAMVPAGPDNPLGAHAINLGWPSYTIHGTNKPDGIGRRSSHGCIRMYPEDIAQLFGMVKVGTPVTIIDSSHSLGWQDENLYLEVNPTQTQSDAIMEYEHVVPLDIPGLEDEIRAAVKGRSHVVDWYMVQKISAARAGIPVAITGESGANRNVLPDLDAKLPAKELLPFEVKPAQGRAAPVNPVNDEPAYDEAVEVPTPPEVAGEAVEPPAPIPLGPAPEVTAPALKPHRGERDMLPVPRRKSAQELLEGRAGDNQGFHPHDLLPASRYQKQGGSQVYWQ